MSRNTAFTLAEVLITLGIIGVVASMTLPTLMTRVQDQKIVSSLEKNYSILSQAWMLMEEKYGAIDSWGIGSTNTGQTDDDGNPIYDTSGSELILERLSEFLKIYNKDASQIKGKPVYNLDGTIQDPILKDPMMVLADGSIIAMGWTTKASTYTKVSIAIMIPPLDRKIVYGENVFYFQGYPHKIFPEGGDNINKFSSSCLSKGRYCTAWVLQFRNLDYKYCKDLSWTGKHKCK